MTNFLTSISKTNWTLAATFVVVAGNAIIPLLPVSIEATVAAVLIAIASIFHVNDVSKAVASAKAPVAPVTPVASAVVESPRV